MNMVLIEDVGIGSPAAKAGVAPGMGLVAIDGRTPKDILDYYAMTDPATLTISVAIDGGTKGPGVGGRSNDGSARHVSDGHDSGGDLAIRDFQVSKAEGEPLGLIFESALFDGIRNCKNRCIFCFVDQLPKGMRRSLYVKDDDYRLSLLWGNFVTLTNLSSGESGRILSERISPLYISVHATDPQVHAHMVQPQGKAASNPFACLSSFLEAGLEIHVQIVLCPGVNDGEVLSGTLADFAQGGAYERVASVGIVPIGLTGHREGRPELRALTPEEAAAVVDSVTGLQKTTRRNSGFSKFYLADEFYLLSERAFPSYSSYDDFPQLENGIGLVRRFLTESNKRLKRAKPMVSWRAATFLTGESAYPVIRRTADVIEKAWQVKIDVIAVKNRFFGGNVSVAPLLTGHDLLPVLTKLKGPVFIPELVFGAEGRLLDGPTLEEINDLVDCQVIAAPTTGGDFIAALHRYKAAA